MVIYYYEKRGWVTNFLENPRDGAQDIKRMLSLDYQWIFIFNRKFTVTTRTATKKSIEEMKNTGLRCFIFFNKNGAYCDKKNIDIVCHKLTDEFRWWEPQQSTWWH